MPHTLIICFVAKCGTNNNVCRRDFGVSTRTLTYWETITRPRVFGIQTSG